MTVLSGCSICVAVRAADGAQGVVYCEDHRKVRMARNEQLLGLPVGGRLPDPAGTGLATTVRGQWWVDVPLSRGLGTWVKVGRAEFE